MPDINSPVPAAASRQPRGAVKLNGAVVVGWTDIEVENNSFRAADTFEVTFALEQLTAPYTLSWFSLQASMSCEIFINEKPADPANYTPAAADSLILGQVDDIDVDLVGRTLKISGRDYTAKLIDTKTTAGYLNKTSSQIATLVAAQAGLTPVVTATHTTVGTFYSQNHMSLTQEQSEWDILCQLAQYENFDVFVKGSSLYFQPKPADNGDRYALVYNDTEAVPIANATEIELMRSLTIAKGVVVTVRSWHSGHKKAFSASYPKSSQSIKPGQSGNSSPLTYNYNLAGKTQDQCQQEAKRRYEQITKNMVKISADLPGDALLDCTKIVQVRGTRSNWDQDFYPDNVHRYLSIEEGYRMSLTAKNLSQEFEADS